VTDDERSHQSNALSMLIASGTAKSFGHHQEASRAAMQALTYSNLELADAVRELRVTLLELGRAEWRARHRPAPVREAEGS
jgi:hypothetical protein